MTTTASQMASLAEAFQWHAIHRDKLLNGARQGSTTYQDAAEYRDLCLMRAGLPSMAVLQSAWTARTDARIVAEREAAK